MLLNREVIAVDRYPNAPAMQVAHRSHVISMLDGAALRRVIEAERPQLIVPEIEAIATPTLLELDEGGFGPFPVYVNRAEGPYKWDVAGRRLIEQQEERTRTSDTVGADGVLLIGETVDPFSTEAVRAIVERLGAERRRCWLVLSACSVRASVSVRCRCLMAAARCSTSDRRR